MNIKILIISLISLSFCLATSAQTNGEAPKTLFPYPTVPDTITTLESRSNYFITHFWDEARLGTQITDIDGLENAFKDYITFFRYAHRNVVRTSINKLMNNAQANVKNFWLIANAAEKYLYSNEATLKSDEAYTMFISNILRSSHLKKKEKERYQMQLKKINTNQVGALAPNFIATDINGKKWEFAKLQADSAATIVLFFTPDDCSDCSIPRLRLSTNTALNSMIKSGEIVFINVTVGDYSKEWAEKASTYGDGWITVISNNINELYNIPENAHTIYLLKNDGTIQNKNITANVLIDAVNQ